MLRDTCWRYVCPSEHKPNHEAGYYAIGAIGYPCCPVGLVALLPLVRETMFMVHALAVVLLTTIFHVV